MVARRRRSVDSALSGGDYVDVMSDEPLTNAAVEFIRRGNASMNAAESPPNVGELSESVSSDFVYDARNSLGVDFGPSDWPEFLGSIWHVSAGRPKFLEPQVLAVQGQRCAVITARIDYGEDAFSEYLHCIVLDPELQRLQRIVSFDSDRPDDRDAAIAELDRMHAELEDQPPS